MFYTKTSTNLQFCEQNSSSIFTFRCPSSQSWHPNFSSLYDVWNYKNHTFSESLRRPLSTDPPTTHSSPSWPTRPTQPDLLSIIQRFYVNVYQPSGSCHPLFTWNFSTRFTRIIRFPRITRFTQLIRFTKNTRLIGITRFTSFTRICTVYYVLFLGVSFFSNFMFFEDIL